LHAAFPAAAARAMGLARTPLLCCQELLVDGALPRCVRVLVHCYLSDGAAAQHVYLRGASGLRADLKE
jgi:chorismate mutase